MVVSLLVALLLQTEPAAPAAPPDPNAPAVNAVAGSGPDAPAAAPAPAADEAKPANSPGAEEAQGHVETPWYEEMLNSGLLGYMFQGGFFMWPILAMAVLAGGVIIERYRTLRLLGTDSTALRTQVRELLEADRVEEALQLCDRETGPVPAILGAGLRKFLVLRRLNYDAGKIEEQVVKAMDDYGVHIIAALEKHIPILATISSVAPMVGFLGTVQGMVVSFADIVAKSKTGAQIIEIAAAGIMVSLLTTVFGLIVGIPAFVAFNYYTSVINKFVLDVEESATELIEGVTLQMALLERSQEPQSDEMVVAK